MRVKTLVVSLLVVLVLIIVAYIVLGPLGDQLNDLHVLTETSRPSVTSIGKIIEIKFDVYTPDVYHCRYSVNSTHAIAVCWAMRDCSHVEKVVLDNGEELGPKDLCGIAEWVNDTRIYVADLVDGYGYMVEDVSLYNEKKGLISRARLLLANQTFSYKWMRLADMFGGVISASTLDVFDEERGRINIAVAVLTYEPVNRSFDTITYAIVPAPPERARMYADAVSAWCTAIESVLGIDCSVRTIDPEEYCRYPNNLTLREHGFVDKLFMDEFTCGRIGRVWVVPIVELPRGIKSSMAGVAEGIYDRDSGSIGMVCVKDSEIPLLTVVHELGHGLGLEDIYLIPIEKRLPM